jgi:hypothetical protein
MGGARLKSFLGMKGVVMDDPMNTWSVEDRDVLSATILENMGILRLWIFEATQQSVVLLVNKDVSSIASTYHGGSNMLVSTHGLLTSRRRRIFTDSSGYITDRRPGNQCVTRNNIVISPLPTLRTCVSGFCSSVTLSTSFVCLAVNWVGWNWHNDWTIDQ